MLFLPIDSIALQAKKQDKNYATLHLEDSVQSKGCVQSKGFATMSPKTCGIAVRVFSTGQCLKVIFLGLAEFHLTSKGRQLTSTVRQIRQHASVVPEQSVD